MYILHQVYCTVYTISFVLLKHLSLERRKPTAITCGDRLLVLFQTGADSKGNNFFRNAFASGKPEIAGPYS
jgi:hypothetical protein